MGEDTRIQAAFTKTGYQVLSSEATSSSLRLVIRIQVNDETQWRVCMNWLLMTALKDGWEVEPAKMYFLKTVGSDVRMFYKWCVTFRGNMAAVTPLIVKAIQSVPRARVEVTEMPLTGAQRNYVNGKGAKNISDGSSRSSSYAADMSLSRLRGG